MEVISRLQSAMRDDGLDVLFVSSYANVFYSAGVVIRTIRSIPGRPAVLIVPADGTPTFVVCNIEERLVRSQSKITDIRTYVEFRDSPAALVADVVRQKRLDRSRIAVEKLYLSAYWYEALMAELPGVQFGHCDGLFDRLRAIKSPLELQIIADAAQITQKAISSALDQIQPEDTEQAVAWRIESLARQLGGTGIRFCYVGSGANSGLIHPIPGPARLEPTGVLRVDVAVYVGMYAADLAYTRLPPRPEASQRHYRDAVWNAKEKVIQNVRAGVRVADLYRHCRNYLHGQDIELWMPHIGHGIGVDGGHEYPLLEPGSDAVLEKGMVLCIEPLCTSPKGEAFHFEDMVVVTETGVTRLTDFRG